MDKSDHFVDSYSLIEAPSELRKRAEKDGYLYIAQLLERGKVLEVRRQVLAVCAAHGLLSEEAPAEAGVRRAQVTLRESPDPRWVALYRDILCLSEFHRLALDAALWAVFSALFDEPPLPHSRNICRVVFPDTAAYTTPPHQDHVYIGGTADTWTAWIPLGDCPRELGGLALVPGSRHWGLLDTKPGLGAGGRQVDVPADAAWAYSPMACGDVLLFHSHTVHQALDNLSKDSLRVSVDYRYQPRGEPLRKDSMEPHMSGFGWTWEDIYADWPEDEPLKYYWRDWNLSFVER
ncbi:MAG: phytanoyl-CoA dioxygenase family protein [FCB group bacterium]|jgi:ectoine hydroxylase-related dioxygenase (phytanoyl-CoA dioxygenase family)|nr:phytanoyl-CoA dioxygenase family protein [FCB group bacterium]